MSGNSSNKEKIIKKTAYEIECMYEANQIAARTLNLLRENIKPGITTEKLNKIAHEYIISQKAYPLFLGYLNYPKSICTSINNEVIHGIPSKSRVLKAGDIISIDVGVLKNNFCGDSAITVPVGNIDPTIERLLKVTEEALYIGISKAVVGNYLGDISNAIQTYVESHGYSVVREFSGHGIGRRLHEPPEVPNFGKKGSGVRLEPGMCLAIEPMVNMGSYHVKVLSDAWTVVTCDNSYSAHFEHTIAITENGTLILSKI